MGAGETRAEGNDGEGEKVVETVNARKIRGDSHSDVVSRHRETLSRMRNNSNLNGSHAAVSHPFYDRRRNKREMNDQKKKLRGDGKRRNGS